MTNGNLRHLDDLRKRVDGETPPAAEPQHEPPPPDDAVPPLDPYAAHEIRIGKTRVLDPKTKAFVEIPAVSCSCGRVGEAVPNSWGATMVARQHALEIGLVRLSRALGIDLDAQPDAIERALGGDAEAIASLHERQQEMAERVEQQRREALAADLAADLDEDTAPAGGEPIEGRTWDGAWVDVGATPNGVEIDPVAERVEAETGGHS